MTSKQTKIVNRENARVHERCHTKKTILITTPNLSQHKNEKPRFKTAI
jgi:hypothetical protein